MVWIIARKEFVERWRDGQFRWVGGLVLLLLAVALAMGWKHNESVRAERASAQRTSRAQWIKQGPRNPHSAAHFGVYAFKPRLPLAALDTGMDAFTGAAVWVEAHYQNPLNYRPAEDATALQRFGELTAATVLQVFLPLVAILLTFATFTGEREQGTLRQLLSLGVPRGTILAGKALGAAGALAVLVVPAALLGTGALALASEHDFLRGSLPRLLPMALAYMAYLAAFVLVALAVSAWAPSSRLALSVLLAFWATTVFLVPRLASDVAERLHPVPSATDFWRGVAADMKGADGHSDNDRRLVELKRRLLAQYGKTRLEDLPVNYEGMRLQLGEEHGNEVFDRRFGALWRTYGAQERVHHLAGLLSPLIAVRSVSMALAGTDLAHLRDFTDAAERYRRMLNKEMNLNVAHNSRFGEYYYFGNQRLWESIPDFAYATPPAGWALQGQWLPLLVLAGWLAAAAGMAVFAVARLRVT